MSMKKRFPLVNVLFLTLTVIFINPTACTYSEKPWEGSVETVGDGNKADLPQGGEAVTNSNEGGGPSTQDSSINQQTVPSLTYHVGVTVSGLVSNPLVLQMNDAEFLPITTNGVFPFPTPLPDGSAYKITIPSQPPNQNCSLVNDSGTIQGANVDNVEVNCVATAGSLPGIPLPLSSLPLSLPPPSNINGTGVISSGGTVSTGTSGTTGTGTGTGGTGTTTTGTGGPASICNEVLVVEKISGNRLPDRATLDVPIGTKKILVISTDAANIQDCTLAMIDSRTATPIVPGALASGSTFGYTVVSGNGSLTLEATCRQGSGAALQIVNCPSKTINVTGDSCQVAIFDGSSRVSNGATLIVPLGTNKNLKITADNLSNFQSCSLSEAGRGPLGSGTILFPVTSGSQTQIFDFSATCQTIGGATVTCGGKIKVQP